MELFLNLAWVLLAVFLLWLWPRFAPPADPRSPRHGLRLQFIALAVLLLILFPVISVTDDLQAMQNPAETDSALRRNHMVSSAHIIFPAIAAPPVPVFAVLSSGMLQMAALGRLPAPASDHPAMTSIQNRPPPSA